MVRFCCSLFTLLVTAALVPSIVVAAPAGQAARPARILVISLDGARPDAILQAETPHIQALAERGAVSWVAQTVFPPGTLPAHASMLTGLAVETHGMVWNYTRLGCQPVIAAPTFLTLAHEAGYRTAMVVGKQKLCHLAPEEGVDDYTFVRDGDWGVANRTIELLEAGYDVIFAHFPNPDFFGHLTGWMSDVYLFELSNTDARVGRVLAALDELDIADETLVFLTADHGGHDHQHGVDIPADMTIPWIVAGPGVVPGTVLSAPVSVADTAPTVLWALGLPFPDDMRGRPIYEAFGVTEPDEEAGVYAPSYRMPLS
jgi:arylsulfatase A-like enzyme